MGPNGIDKKQNYRTYNDKSDFEAYCRQNCSDQHSVMLTGETWVSTTENKQSGKMHSKWL